MSLHLYQVVILALAAFMIFQGGKKYLTHEDNQTFLKFAVRIIVWGGMAAIAIYPNLSNQVALFIGIEGNINAVILVGFILVFLMIFKILSAVESLEQQITSLTRKESLDDLKENKND
ncbi:MAG: DUF2304 domain-containing protein [Candidatus Moranbacteria bacterium]|nr:DUF2304 domain-containing protein [Candidatus Moranbacteria bacterium]